ncbi:MAG TPA: heme NO-binding protein [Aliiroseovarius sp.]|nr:heme NO-binding protein [Aliiroseovarius sp.]
MHGLINRSLEGFLRATYGDDLWRMVTDELDAGIDTFEAMFTYDDALTRALVDAAAGLLDKPRETVLEDFGTFLVADPRNERVRRLLRFGGVDYTDFLHSLDDLRGRARLAVPNLDLPRLELEETDGEFILTCISPQAGFGHVLLGLLRALADDYGALAFLEHCGRKGDIETLSVRVVEAGFTEGRDFSLAREPA